MNKTELAIIEQIAKLEESEQEKVLALARQLVNEKTNEAEAKPFDWDDWLDKARKSREELRAKYGDKHFNSQAVLDELREEASEWPRKS
jgi:hypothetical protein